MADFDPSVMAELRIRAETFEDCLRTVCHHLGLPQSETGPCDDATLYGRALEALDLAYRSAEAERALSVSRQHRAEAALVPFAQAGAKVAGMWDDARRAETVNIPGLKIADYRRAKQVLDIAGETDRGAAPMPPRRPRSASAVVEPSHPASIAGEGQRNRG